MHRSAVITATIVFGALSAPLQAQATAMVPWSGQQQQRLRDRITQQLQLGQTTLDRVNPEKPLRTLNDSLIAMSTLQRPTAPAQLATSGLTCPMPVAVVGPGQVEPMPAASPGTEPVEPMPVARPSCTNPLFKK